MNSYTNIAIDYIRSSRTIETVLVSNNQIEKVFFVYNCDGISYRLFYTASSLISFFENKDSDCDMCFEKEIKLDEFFANVILT